MKFRDTLNFISGSVSSLPRSVGLSSDLVANGDFPHRVNLPENWDKIINFPDIDQFIIEKRATEEREKFIIWHAAEKLKNSNLLNFRYEITKYCSNDVTVLRLCVLKFRDDFISLTKVDPFAEITIASACRRYFTTFLMVSNKIGIISAHGYQPNRRTSIEATEYFEFMNKFVADGNIEHGRNGKEIKVLSFFLDGIDYTTNTVYEYNGCVFHGCEKCTNPMDKVPFRNITMAQAYEETEHKRTYLEICGFHVETMWSCEWNRLKIEDDKVREFVVTLNLQPPLLPHDAFCGGRTNASVLKYDCKENEKIYHLDVISLYPTVNKKDLYPLYHPEIILNDFIDIKNYFGFVKCTVLAPYKDHFPVLPMKFDGKLIFPLCTQCAVEKCQDFCLHT
ncbi:MAG: DNA polymerase, partial [Ignavibacteria bacterium]|nr:DNA polymerase [Ignavibacteria bacterium]